MSERLVPSGACMFSCLLIGVNRLAVRAHVNCGFVLTCELCNVFFWCGRGGGGEGSGFLTHSVVVCVQFISEEEEECFLGHSRGVCCLRVAD